nr:CBS domain-containing protein [Cohnella algarum]
MVARVYKAKETDSVRSVIEKFIEFRIGGMPVVNERNEIVAYISDGDIMRYLGRNRNSISDFVYAYATFNGFADSFDDRTRSLLETNVMAIARKKVITVAWDEEIENIAAILGKKQIKKVPVERKGALVGIISRGDVIRHVFKP